MEVEKDSINVKGNVYVVFINVFMDGFICKIGGLVMRSFVAIKS